MSYFAIVGSLIFLAFNLYCYLSLSKNAVFRKIKTLLLFLFAVIFSFELAFFFGWTSSNAFAYKLAIFALAFSFLSFCVLVPSDIVGAIFASRRKTERARVRAMYDMVVIALLICYVVVGFTNALYDTKVTKRQIQIAGLKEPLKAVMVSDLHIGAFLKRDFSQKIVNLINAQNPDVVFIVGDFIDTKAAKLEDSLEPFKELKSKEGVFYVSGNHEYYNGITPILETITNLNINILDNAHMSLKNINIAGISDISGLRFDMPSDPAKALSDLDDKPVIFLAHQPKAVELLSPEQMEQIDLILSGHTHAGQVFPFSLLVWLAQGYIYGEYELSPKTKLVVSSGAGFWGPPMRILSNSEIVVLELSPKKDDK